MKKLLATSIFLFSLCHIDAQSLDQFPLDSLIQWVSDNAYGIYKNKNAAEVHHYASLSLSRAKEIGEPTTVVRAAQNLATLHYLLTEDESIPDSSLHYDQMALDYLLQANDTAAIAKAYNYVAGDYQTLEDYESAQAYYLKSLETYESINDRAGMGKVYSNISLLYGTSKDYERAIQYGEKSIEIAKEMETPDSIDLGIRYFYLVRSYIGAKQLDKALEAGDKSVQLIEPNAAQSPFALARAYRFRGIAYQELQAYDKALADHRRAVKVVKSQMGEDALMSDYGLAIGEVLRLQENCGEAIPYYEQFFSEMTNPDSYGYEAIIQWHIQLSGCYEKMGRYAEALAQHQAAALVKDSLTNSRYQSLESELIQKYESDKKDEQIALQTATIQQQQQIQWLSIGLATLFALLLIGLFFNYRRNKKTNVLLQHLNTDLAQKNQQNEILLKEIHHRVKNNLQTISSLLSLQSAHIEDPEIQGAVEQSQNRVQSMALIHQKLYQGENLASIEMKAYLQTLGETIVDTFGIDINQVEIEYPMEQVELDVDTAIPIGLIANELLTNALKYAFPKNRKGKVKVSLQRIGERFRFLVADDGIGVIKDNSATKSGFGTQLVQLLVMQMDGKIETKNQEGVATVIEFSLG